MTCFLALHFNSSGSFSKMRPGFQVWPATPSPLDTPPQPSVGPTVSLLANPVGKDLWAVCFEFVRTTFNDDASLKHIYFPIDVLVADSQ